MDVDGTLTTGHIYMSAQGEYIKVFHAQDGYGIRNILPKYNIVPVIITGRVSAITEMRCKELGIAEVMQGQMDKIQALKQVMGKFQAECHEIAYIGDDLNDLECIKLCGITACPCNAVDEIKLQVDYVCEKEGGNGAVREFVDYLEKMV